MSRGGRSRVVAAAVVPVALAAAVFAAGCSRERAAQEPAAASAAELRITYPLEGTLFPPESVAPTFVWKDETGRVDRWDVTVRDDTGGEILRESVDAPRWRPSEDSWTLIKRHSSERDAEVLVAGVDRTKRATAASAAVHIRTSKDAVGDSLFYREVPLPFLKAVQDPSRIRWRFGSIDAESGPPIVLQNLPVCGNCHSFSDNGKVLGLDVDYGNDKGAYAIVPV